MSGHLVDHNVLHFHVLHFQRLVVVLLLVPRMMMMMMLMMMMMITRQLLMVFLAEIVDLQVLLHDYTVRRASLVVMKYSHNLMFYHVALLLQHATVTRYYR